MGTSGNIQCQTYIVTTGTYIHMCTVSFGLNVRPPPHLPPCTPAAGRPRPAGGSDGALGHGVPANDHGLAGLRGV